MQGTVFSEEDEKHDRYKLPLDHDKYFYVACYRKKGENKHQLILQIELSDPVHTEYPFNRLIENSVLPNITDDGSQHLMRKYSKHSKAVPMNQNDRIEEFHFMHPNSGSSTINIDVITFKRQTSSSDTLPPPEEETESIDSSTPPIVVGQPSPMIEEDMYLVGVVSDTVNKERRKTFMLRLRDICREALLEYATTFQIKMTTQGEDQVLRGITTQVLELNNST